MRGDGGDDDESEAVNAQEGLDRLGAALDGEGVGALLLTCLGALPPAAAWKQTHPTLYLHTTSEKPNSILTLLHTKHGGAAATKQAHSYHAYSLRYLKKTLNAKRVPTLTRDGVAIER